MSSSSTSDVIGASEHNATPKEKELHCNRLTSTELDELGVDLERQPDGSLKIASPPQRPYLIYIWNKWHPTQIIGVGDVITRVNGIGTDRPDLMWERLHSDTELELTVRCGDRTETPTSNVMGASEHNE